MEAKALTYGKYANIKNDYLFYRKFFKYIITQKYSAELLLLFII